MASKKYFDLSSYNMTTDWRRIELPFRRLAEDPEFYIFAAILLTALSAPLNFFLIIQILRYVFIIDVYYRGGGSGCAGCVAAHPFFGSFIW